MTDLFLDFLEHDILVHPENLKPVTESFARRLRELVDDVEVGADERIDDPVAI